MADFLKAFHITVLENEGGYNPGIGEKETYMGIDRGANPDWSGWNIIDIVKRNNAGLSTATINLLLSQNIGLQAGIKIFYKTNYWDTLSLNKVNDQQLATNLFDCSVNQGSGRACKFMQQACNNITTANKSAVKMLLVDRHIGAATISAFNDLPAAQLNVQINVLREASYRSDKRFAQWGKIWLKRLKQYINHDSN